MTDRQLKRLVIQWHDSAKAVAEIVDGTNLENVSNVGRLATQLKHARDALFEYAEGNFP